jgi:hypothetical protein
MAVKTSTSKKSTPTKSSASKSKGGAKSSSGSKTPSKSHSKTPSKTSSKRTTKSSKKTGSDSDDKGSGKRHFRIVTQDGAETYGRYSGSNPKQAASKAYSAFLRKLRQEGKDEPKQPIQLILRESTRGSKHREYMYTAYRKQLDEPTTVTIDNDGDLKEVTYNYKNIVKKLSQEGGAKKSRKSAKGKSTKAESKTKSKSKSKGESKPKSKKSSSAGTKSKSSASKSAKSKKTK